MPEKYSTPQAAKRIGVTDITLYHWIKAGKIRPSEEIPFLGKGDKRHIWLWTDEDIAEARKLKAENKPGPKPKKKKK